MWFQIIKKINDDKIKHNMMDVKSLIYVWLEWKWIKQHVFDKAFWEQTCD